MEPQMAQRASNTHTVHQIVESRGASLINKHVNCTVTCFLLRSHCIAMDTPNAGQVVGTSSMRVFLRSRRAGCTIAARAATPRGRCRAALGSLPLLPRMILTEYRKLSAVSSCTMRCDHSNAAAFILAMATAQVSRSVLASTLERTLNTWAAWCV